MKALLLPVFLSLLVFGIPADFQEVPWIEGVTSPRIESLKEQVHNGNSRALAEFWEEMEARHTPLVEELPRDPRHVLVTFLYQAQGPTKGVVLISQLSTKRDPAGDVFSRLLATDGWYKTFVLPADLRLSY